MLYPIELLGQNDSHQAKGTATDGVHVNGRGGFCHVVRGLFKCRPSLARAIAVSPREYGHLA
ncbi:hypothetical protein FKZ69_25430 [Pseudomonas azotoformans]|nr:hypothetical protein FKZ69_25430 [Pseudomonas azotoformans]